jgi:ribosomal protein S18 acetylase RimI-like enzyme
MNEVTIRHANVSDYRDMQFVIAAAWAQYRAYMSKDDWVTMEAGILNLNIVGANGRLLLASVENRIIGVVAYGSPGKLLQDIIPVEWASIARMSVLPNCTRLGIGQKLLHACIELAVKDGVKVIGLHTSKRMTGAIELYTKCGFVHDADLPNRYGWSFARYRKNCENKK